MELLVVMAILAVTAVFSVGALSSLLSGSVLGEKVSETTLSLRTAQQDASISNVPVSVHSTGCAMAFAYMNPPSGEALPALPQNETAPPEIACSGSIHGYWLPSNLFVSSLTTLTPSNQSMTMQNGEGRTSTIQISAGGMIIP